METQIEWFCPLCHAIVDDIVLTNRDIYLCDYICYECSIKLLPSTPRSDVVLLEED